MTNTEQMFLMACNKRLMLSVVQMMSEGIFGNHYEPSVENWLNFSYHLVVLSITCNIYMQER